MQCCDGLQLGFFPLTNENLLQVAYPAQLAGLRCVTSTTQEGLELTFRG